MKYFLIFASLLIFSCSGCFKEDKACTPVAPASEENQIKTYATANGMNVVKHNSGIYYEILSPGTGTTTPTLRSKVFVTYTGKLLSGTQFDQSSNVISFFLNQVIEGWQIGIPLVKAGGKIKLIIPSALAYGCNGRPGIPANSVLFFEVDLIDVQ
ncbi:MAG TPA: FKBP-type peptidyl-prolyl cis-trans isomerase [Segetibacter sp.]|jgi:FKBP-type peptidyl-prolyl cis-trans isomerase